MQEQSWREIAESVGGRFEQHGGSTHRVTAKAGTWTVVLDTVFAAAWPDLASDRTRLRAPYTSSDSFRFVLQNESVVSAAQRLLGKRDITTGDDVLDRSYEVESNDAARLRQLLSDPALRELLTRHASEPRPMVIRNQRRDDHRAQIVPDTLCEVNIEVWPIVTDKEQLGTLFELTGRLLDGLSAMGSARQDGD